MSGLIPDCGFYISWLVVVRRRTMSITLYYPVPVRDKKCPTCARGAGVRCSPESSLEYPYG